EEALYTITAPNASRHSVAVVSIRCSSGGAGRLLAPPVLLGGCCCLTPALRAVAGPGISGLRPARGTAPRAPRNRGTGHSSHTPATTGPCPRAGKRRRRRPPPARALPARGAGRPCLQAPAQAAARPRRSGRPPCSVRPRVARAARSPGPFRG